MINEISKYLRHLSCSISKDFLRVRLESHPDYPSLVAVQDTLAELGIEANAYETSREELVKSGKPFLAHLNIGEGVINFFSDIGMAERKIKDFTSYWSGVVMLLGETKNYDNADHDLVHRNEKQIHFFKIALLGALLVSVFTIAISINSIYATLLCLANAIGLYVSWLIVEKEFGISNAISDKICSMAKYSRCESVLFSKGARIFNWLSWGDIGIVYFSVSLVYITYSLMTGGNSGLQFYMLLSFTGLAFLIYSLYYQWRVVKQWCMLCIGVLGVLVANAFISLIHQSPLTASAKQLYPVALFFIVVTIILLFAWQIVKSIYQKGLQSLQQEIRVTRLKRNPDIFNALLQQQEANPVNLPEPDEPIRFGNPDAPYQLVIACNPYCGPCAKAHMAVEKLHEKNPERFQVAIRFALSSTNSEDSRTRAATEIIRAAKETPFEAIKEWYHFYDLDKFQQKHKYAQINVSAEIEKHISWSREAEIKATPTFYLNGRKLPELFSWIDLVELLDYQIRS